MCAGARNSEELLAYIDKKLERNIELMIPRSNVASKDLVLGLEKLGFKTNSWIGYDNISKEMSSFDVQTNDVLLLSSLIWAGGEGQLCFLIGCIHHGLRCAISCFIQLLV